MAPGAVIPVLDPAFSVIELFVRSAFATAPKLGAPEALPCRTVAVVPSDPRTVGAAPAPPPSTRRLAVRAADVERVEVVSKYGTPPDVPVTVKPSVPLPVTGVPV